MRRHSMFIGMLIGSLTWLTPSLPAQDAARQEAEENYKNLSARIEDLAAANESMQNAIARLREDMGKLAEEVVKAGDRNKENAATTESLNKLKRAIEEVDNKRLTDQKLVLAELADIKEAIKRFLDRPLPKSNLNPSPAPGPTPAPGPRGNGTHPQRTDTKTDTPPISRENMSVYKIQDGDTLSLIVAELRKKGLKITQKQIMDVNPKVVWTRLTIGQSIYIPVPPQ